MKPKFPSAEVLKISNQQASIMGLVFLCTDAWDEQVLNCLFIAEKENVLF